MIMTLNQETRWAYILQILSTTWAHKHKKHRFSNGPNCGLNLLGLKITDISQQPTTKLLFYQQNCNTCTIL